MRRLRPAFVLTFSAVGVACGAPDSPDPRPETTNPPYPVETATAIATTTAAPTTTASATPTAQSSAKPVAYTKAMNARTKSGETIYRASDGCVIDVPSPGRHGSWHPPNTKSVPCPPEMKDPAWAQCIGGTLSATEDLSECLCSMDGNPPPPDVKMACPKAAK